MKTKQKLGVIVVCFIIITLCIILMIYLLSKKNSDSSLDQRREEIVKILDKGIKLQDLLKSDKLDSKASYQNDLGDDCYTYLGEDTEEKIKEIEEVYYNFETNISLFDKAFIESDDKTQIPILYVCPSKKCPSVLKYNKHFKIEKVNDEILSIDIENSSYLVSTRDNQYRLVSELYACPFEVPEDKKSEDVQEIIVKRK